MLSFSGVTFVLFCFVSFFLLSLKPRPFVHRSLFFNHALRQPHAVTTVCVLFRFCFFGDVAFSEYFGTITAFSLYVEYVVRFFPSGWCLKKNQNAPRPSEHPPVRGGRCQNVQVGSKAAITKPLHGI